MTDAPKSDQLTLPLLRALSARSAQFLSVRVTGSQLPKRVREGAAAHGVETVGDLTAYSAEALLTWPGIGGVVLHRAGIALCEMAGLPTSIMRRTRWDELRGSWRLPTHRPPAARGRSVRPTASRRRPPAPYAPTA